MDNLGIANWGILMATFAVYFVQLLKIKPMPSVLQHSYYFCFMIIFFASITTPLLHLNHGLNLTIDSLLFMVAQIIILLSLWQLLSTNGVAVRLIMQKLPRLYCQWFGHILLAVSYLLWSYQFSKLIAAPLSAILLVLHGCSLMFVSLQASQTKTIKLASAFFIVACGKVLLVDMANFLIVQKVIAFMLIGAILLAVSYFYQKMKNQQVKQLE